MLANVLLLLLLTSITWLTLIRFPHWKVTFSLHLALYSYISMDPWVLIFIFQIIIQYYFILLLKQFQFGHWESFHWVFYPFHETNHSEVPCCFCVYCSSLSLLLPFCLILALSTSLPSCPTRCYRPVLYVSCPVPEPSISLRSPASFH